MSFNSLSSFNYYAPYICTVSPSTSHDIIAREEQSSSTSEIADIQGGHPTSELSQQEGQSEKDGNTQKSSGRKRKRHAMIGPMLPPKQTTEQQGSDAQIKVSSVTPPLPNTHKHATPANKAPMSKGSLEFLPPICIHRYKLYST